MKIFLATKNPGKISEFKEILSELRVDLLHVMTWKFLMLRKLALHLLKMLF